MKLNFKYVTFMAAALVLGFGSCSNDEAMGGEQGVIEGKPASLSLTLVDNGSGNAITYAPPTEPTLPAKAEESTINAADQHVYIFNAAGKLEYTGSNLANITLVSGPKKIYLVANVTTPGFTTFIPTIGNAAATEANLLAEKFALTTPAISDVATDNNFYISNVGGPGSVNIAPGANSMNLNIGRGVAKVNIDMSQATAPATGALTGAKYLIANNPADIYFVPNYDAGQLQTPFFSSATGASVYFNNGTVTATGITQTDLKPTDGALANTSYATENAIAAANVNYGTISYAIIQGIFAPNAVVDVANTTATYIAGADFWRIRYIEQNGGTTVADHGYYAAFVVGAAPTTSDAVYTAAQAVAPAAGSGSTIVLSIVKYTGDGSTGAYCYYYLGLGDTRITTVGQETARFTVERNKYYYYQVASIADCGSHTPEPEPGIVPPLTSTLDINFVTAPWGVVGGAGGLNPGI